MVSELMTNALEHTDTRGPVVTASIDVGLVEVMVTDEGVGFVPRPRDPGRSTGGFGLELVERAATRWGVDRLGGTRVWFELTGAGPARVGARSRRRTAAAR